MILSYSKADDYYTPNPAKTVAHERAADLLSKPDNKSSKYGKHERISSLPSRNNTKEENLGDTTFEPKSDSTNIDNTDAERPFTIPPPQKGETSSEGLDPESLMFRDGRRRIDMILAFEDEDNEAASDKATRRQKREIFQANLIKNGLELELENKRLSFDEKTWFLKIHLPWKTEMQLGEITGIKMPTKRFITISVKPLTEEEQADIDQKWYSKLRRKWNQFHEYSKITHEPSFYESTDRKGVRREEQFLIKDRHKQYTPSQRSFLVMQVLSRAKFHKTDKTKLGIKRLLNDGTYKACFPLHEGRYDIDKSDGTITDRRLLYTEWARPSKWYKKQPLWLIKKYFGIKIGLYFCWLGFYTKMLYAPAIVGIMCVLYGLASMDSSDNIPSKEICDVNGPGNITLCPLCDKACHYQRLSDSCVFAKLSYLFDNPSTVFYSIFISIWATTFLELWKRKQTLLKWEWDLIGVDQDENPRPEFVASVKTFHMNPVTRVKEPYMPQCQQTLRFVASGSIVLFMDENPRPEFVASVKTFHMNPVTRVKEPYMPQCQQTLRFVASGSIVLFMITIAAAAVLGTIIYRISMVSVIYSGIGIPLLKRYTRLFTAITAALINLVIIIIHTWIYERVAVALTNIENPRTRSEYEGSYCFKMFLLEFINFYSSLIYIAFFKGRFYDHPGDNEARKSQIYRLKGDICDPVGCLSELCIHLAIIMTGKRFAQVLMEIVSPKVRNWWRQFTHRVVTKDLNKPHMSWEQDYHLPECNRLALYHEYLEMIIQYGFVTLFVAAFPLIPLFALVNNIAEIRIDAYKLVTQIRRPLAERVEDIGAWYGILRLITYMAVVTNAFVIAYTSDFIPRMVYKMVYSPDQTLTGYINHSLSLFNTSDYLQEWGAEQEEDPPTCSYRGYRNPPDHEHPYIPSAEYWHVLAARLAFIVIFEHIVFSLTVVMRLIIPDVPSELRIQMQREALLAKEAKYEHARQRLSNEYRQLFPNNKTSDDELKKDT